MYGDRFRKVEVEGRGGLLRQGSVLIVTAYATRTSPVFRGKYVLSTFLDTPPPPPVPFATDTPAELGSYRATLETPRGAITIELLAGKAPETVRAFLQAAQAGVYDGTPFYRVVKNFVERPRPCHEVDGARVVEKIHLVVPCGSGYSFPSSHAVNAFAIATFVAVSVVESHHTDVVVGINKKGPGKHRPYAFDLYFRSSPKKRRWQTMHTWLRSASASCSERAAGMFNLSRNRIEDGMVASMKASSVG